MPQIFTVENRGVGGAGGMHDHGIPERDPDEAVKLDSGNHVALGETDYVAPGKDFDLSLRGFRRDRR